MDFTISDEVKSVQQLAAQILGDFTEVDKLKAIEQQDDVFDEKLWAALADAGLLGLDIAESQGGMDTPARLCSHIYKICTSQFVWRCHLIFNVLVPLTNNL